MTAFTKDEQWDYNYDLFAVDMNGKIGHFSHVGFRLLPPSIAKSKEKWEHLFNYFSNLQIRESTYQICPDLRRHLNNNFLGNLDQYLKPSIEMSLRGLYSYDSYDDSRKNRPYFRVTIPKNELNMDHLPGDIKDILESLIMNNINFAQNSLILEEVMAKL